ncbi:MAG TPA: HAD family hydrolase [Candidatus Acidoferrales bacterium]|nr:HAD family hydrolase [Candidatus Acidoferrales bacterium]
MHRNIQAVFFDAGYTLLCMDPDQPTIFRNVCAELEIELDHTRFHDGIAHANAMLAPRQPHEVPKPFSRTAIDEFWIAYNRALLSVCARRPRDAEKAEDVYRRFEASISWRVYDEVRPVLADLRERGLRLGVISNWTGDLEEVLAGVGLRKAFDFVLDSARLGHEKPHDPIFAEAVRRADVARDAALHVGDSPEHDVEGAIASGLSAVLLDRNARHHGYRKAPRIENLRELSSFLEQLGAREHEHARDGGSQVPDR